MPVYEYRCLKCNKEFSETLSIEEHESAKIKCPECRSEEVERVFSAFFAKTSKKS